MTANNQNLCHLTIAQAGRLISARELSPVELTRAFLDRIEALEPVLHTYAAVLPGSAMAEARTAESEILQGRYRGPLHGIPVAHKDGYDVANVRTTAYPGGFSHPTPSRDSTAVARLRNAGAIHLGKVVMMGLSMAGPDTSLLEQARNPWDTGCIPGGSSSGSGVSVAAGLAMASMGEDTAGSIRGPASWCGIVGLKPTFGRVSRSGLAGLAWSLDHTGPMAWTVEDCALVLQTVAGQDPTDPASSHAPVPDYTATLRRGAQGLTVGVPRHYIEDPALNVDSETLAAFNKALSALESLGARVEEVTIPSLEYASVATVVIWLAETFGYHRENLRTRPEQLDSYGDAIRTMSYLGAFLSQDYVRAQQARKVVRKEFVETFQKVDLLAMPTSPRPAPAFDSFDIRELLGHMIDQNFMGPFNLVGTPALSINCGFSQRGLPIGLQLVGRPFAEPTIFQLAHAYERYAGWYTLRPTVS